MYFSEKFNVSRDLIKNYGSIDISLVCDLPLFIDPMLIFNSNKKEYKSLHSYLIRFFSFLTDKSEGEINLDDIKAYFYFSEIKNNWFGYSKNGNKGRGLGEKFALFLAENLKFIMSDNDISKSKHIEKALLIYDGNGKDKISDLTTKLILDYLAIYTQNFATKYIDSKYLDTFWLESKFNFKTECFESINYELPFFVNDKGEKEYVLLTPCDILRGEDPAISKSNLKNSYYQIRNIIGNEVHRAQLNNYITKAVKEYRLSQRGKKKKISDAMIERIEKEAFFKALKEKEFSWLYDYFIKVIEDSGISINKKAMQECVDQIERFYYSAEEIKKLLYKNDTNFKKISRNAHEELLNKVLFLKDTIENKEGYKLLYQKDKCITSEDNLQRLFRFTLDGTPYDFNFDGNNGSGEYDIKASKGSGDKCLAELKLASNSRITHIFDQTQVYEKANNCCNSIYVIFYFNEQEKLKMENLMNNNEQFKANRNSIVLIDCIQNKKSASKL